MRGKGGSGAGQACSFQESPELSGKQLLRLSALGGFLGTWQPRRGFPRCPVLPLAPLDLVWGGDRIPASVAGQGTGETSPVLTVLPALSPQARFTADCQFRERFQENSYNTYASAVHRSPRSGRQWYVALNKRGKAKRGCSPRARPQHVSTHFLPRFRQPQPPELAFTVTLPEKKPPPPPPKPKVALNPPRKNPGPVKYRLKFRFG